MSWYGYKNELILLVIVNFSKKPVSIRIEKTRNDGNDYVVINAPITTVLVTVDSGFSLKPCRTHFLSYL